MRRTPILTLLLLALVSQASDPADRAAHDDPAHQIQPTGADCNGNGVPDATDIAQGTSLDCDLNDIPDECDTQIAFTGNLISESADGVRAADVADVDGDGRLDVLSASFNDRKIHWYRNLGGVGQFGPPTVISELPGDPVAVVAADIDGDGDIDALSSTLGVSQVNWHENLGGVLWATHLVSSAVADPFSVFAADVDGDGDLDVFSVSQIDNKIAWYENLGGGTFGLQQLISTQLDLPVGLHATDMDGDGDVDVAASGFLGNEFAWFENSNGLGTFGPKQVISSNSPGAAFIDLADIDGDGDQDFLGASNLSGVIAWFAKVDGADAFGPPLLVTSTAFGVLWVAAADMDVDGDLDVVSASLSSDTVAWYENLGGGSFGPTRIITDAAEQATSAVPADIDADGDVDVVVTSQADDRVVWHENQSDDCNDNQVPDGCEPDCNANGLADSCDIANSGSPDCNANGIPDACDALAGQDCTKNGVPDECEPDCNANLQADSCDIDGGMSADCSGNGIPDECEPDCNANQQADSCDIDGGTSIDCSGNGIPDECEPDCNGNMQADVCDLEQQSKDCNANGVLDECDIGAGSTDCNGNLVPDECDTLVKFTVQVITTQADLVRSVLAVDLDGDGDADVLSASGIDDTVAWYENADGLGTFGPQQIISNAGDIPVSVFAFDADGDMDLDVLAASFGDDEVAWYQQALPGVFGPQQLVTQQADGAQSVYAADLDGDLDPDVLSASFNDGKLAWYENLGGGTFGPERVVATAADGLFAVRAADLDGDLDVDLLAASFNDDTVSWYENLDGAGTFGPRQVVASDADGATFVIGHDFDGDGDADLAWAGQVGDRAAWHENLNGGGLFGPAQPLPTIANGATALHAEDIDGDGDGDLLVASLFDNSIAWNENLDGLGTFGPAQVLAADMIGAYSVHAADIDNDGDMDVVSGSQNDDRIVWYENTSGDCNANGIPDTCDIASGVSDDCTANGAPDECESDCNANGEADSCDILAGFSEDCNFNGYPDECETDCNGNGLLDSCDVSSGSSDDCNGNVVPDECEGDCNGNGQPDDCDVVEGADDCNQNSVPDECDGPDCNGNAVPDACDLAQGTSQDCDANLVPDECDPDCNDDGISDACDFDCNVNGVPDGCESPDCNGNGFPDECDIEFGPSADCNANGIPDECDTACRIDCDTDGDLCIDEFDLAPGNASVCADTDVDGCDDCRFGGWDPDFDGVDNDEDGFCDLNDCDASNSGVWAAPGPAQALLLTKTGVADVLLDWQPPLFPGALFLQFDTLRSQDADDFVTLAVCLESDDFDLTAQDNGPPAPGELLVYLIRTENTCPGTPGSMGADSAGVPRSGLACP